MADNICPREEDHERRISKLESRFDDLYERFYNSDKHFAVLFAEISGSLDALSGLPDAIGEMTTTMIQMQASINDNGSKTDELSGTVNKLSAKVDEMDAKDKISMLAFLKANWPVIVVSVLFAGYVIADAAKNFLS